MAFHINRSITIKAEQAKIYSVLSDLREWKNWSPWLVIEPDADVKYSTDGKVQNWKGDILGEGELKVVKEDKASTIDYSLNFLKPRQPEARISFSLKPIGQAVAVTWTMDSKMPFPLFFLKGIITNIVGMDYERALAMLKEYLEQGSIHASQAKPCIDNLETIHYVGKYTPAIPLSSIAESMPDFKTIANDIAKYGEPGKGVNIYHKMNIRKMTMDITTGFSVPATAMEAMHRSLSSKYRYGTVQAGRGIHVAYRGGYTHIGNAWSAATTFMRKKKHRSRGITGLEIYHVGPTETSEEKNYQTSIWIPVK